MLCVVYKVVLCVVYKVVLFVMCYVLCVVYEIRLCHRLQLGVKLPCLLMTGPVSPHRHHLYL